RSSQWSQFVNRVIPYIHSFIRDRADKIAILIEKKSIMTVRNVFRQSEFLYGFIVYMLANFPIMTVLRNPPFHHLPADNCCVGCRQDASRLLITSWSKNSC